MACAELHRFGCERHRHNAHVTRHHVKIERNLGSGELLGRKGSQYCWAPRPPVLAPREARGDVAGVFRDVARCLVTCRCQGRVMVPRWKKVRSDDRRRVGVGAGGRRRRSAGGGGGGGCAGAPDDAAGGSRNPKSQNFLWRLRRVRKEVWIDALCNTAALAVTRCRS